VNPGAAEICDGKDNNCNGVIDEGCGAITVTANKTAASSCADDGKITLLKTGGTSPFTYSIDGVHYQTSNKFTGLAAGTYTGFVKDSKNNLGTVSGITITKAAQLVVSAKATAASFCADDGTITITKTGGTAPFTYSIDGVNFFTSNKFTGVAGGSYTAYVKDARCPAVSVGVVVDKPAPIVITIKKTAASFCADDGSITITRTGGTGPFTYSLDGVNFGTSNKFTGLAGGTYTAWLKDAKCPAVSLGGIVITKAAQLVVKATKTDATACYDDGTITLTRTGGIAPFTYSLDGVNFVSTNVFTGLAAGTYTGWVKDSRCAAVSVPGITISTTVCNSISSSSTTGGENSSIKVVKSSVAIFPNPANDVLHVELRGYSGRVTLQLRNLDGKALLEKKLDMQSSVVTQEQLNVRTFTTGLYLLTAINENGDRQTEKVIIAH
jgi:guanyl-specific ribonuclease Sa